MGVMAAGILTGGWSVADCLELDFSMSGIGYNDTAMQKTHTFSIYDKAASDRLIFVIQFHFMLYVYEIYTLEIIYV